MAPWTSIWSGLQSKRNYASITQICLKLFEVAFMVNSSKLSLTKGFYIFFLQINDVEFGNGHREFMDSSYGQDLTRFPLNFAFLSGQIPEVCPHEDESIWALNVKRGLLSAFQNTLTTTSSSTSSSSGRGQNSHEVDVVGICPTSYKQEFQSENEARYIKSKDMKECSRNQKLHQHALNVPDINIQHLPLLEWVHKTFSYQSGLRTETYSLGANMSAMWPFEMGFCTRPSAKKNTFSSLLAMETLKELSLNKRKVWNFAEVKQAPVPHHWVDFFEGYLALHQEC